MVTVETVRNKLLEALDEWYEYNLHTQDIKDWNSEKEHELYVDVIERYQDYKAVAYYKDDTDLNFDDYQ